jgi:hypothetical protein
MKIECILRRTPPTTVILGDTAYKFQADDQGRHVCEVSDQLHLARLLSISEAYRLPGDEPVPEALKPAIAEQTLPTFAPTLAPVDENIIKGSAVHSATFDLGGPELVELADVVVHALDLSGLTTPEWNSLPDEDRHTFIDIALDELDTREPTESQSELVPAAKSTTETAPVSVAGNSNGDALNDAPGVTDAEQEGLRAEYLAKFGKKPHHKFSAEKLRTLLAADALTDDKE